MRSPLFAFCNLPLHSLCSLHPLCYTALLFLPRQQRRKNPREKAIFDHLIKKISSWINTRCLKWHCMALNVHFCFVSDLFLIKKKKKQSQTTSNIIKPTLARPQAGIKPWDLQRRSRWQNHMGKGQGGRWEIAATRKCCKLGILRCSLGKGSSPLCS